MEAEAVDANASKETESVQEKEKEIPQPLQVSVNEKVIFCIDSSIFSDSGDDDKVVEEMLDILLLYMKMKKRICIKPVEFHCLLCCHGKVSTVVINEGKDLRNALMSLKGEEETQELDLSVLFTTLAKTLELPDPKICNEIIPSPLVYHCLLLFGHNKYPPVMKDPNAFDFLVQNPFFAFDTVYIYNNSVEGNDCETIANALYSMYDVLNGYFYTVNCQDSDKQYSVFAQLLGHPFIRPPQNKAKFDLKLLTSQDNVK